MENGFMMRLSLLLIAVLPALGLGSVFDDPELQVAPSPSAPVQIRLAGVRVIDSEVSPTPPWRSALGLGSVFDDPELQVAPSPSAPVQIRLAGVRVIDSEVSPTGPLVALLVSN